MLLGLAALGLAACFTGPAWGQDFKRPDGSVPLPLDWSDQHLIYTVGFTPEQASKMQADPRYFVAAHAHGKALTDAMAGIGYPAVTRKTTAGAPVAIVRTAGATRGTPPVERALPAAKTKQGLNKDWSVSLGVGGVAAGMYPAKYDFDVNAAPNCTNDFAVFPVNTTTGSTRSKVVATFTTSASSAGSVKFVVTPNGQSAVTLTLNAVTSGSTNSTQFVVSTSTNQEATDATNLATAINDNLSTTTPASARMVAIPNVPSAGDVNVYALAPGTAATISSSVVSGISNLSVAATNGTDGSQADIVGFNQLYSGTSPSPYCTGLSFPEFTFSYAAGVGGVATSPVLTLDGKQIIFVENDSNIGAILHHLTIGSGTKEYGTCTNSGTATPTCAIHAVTPDGSGGSTATDDMLPLDLALVTAGTVDVDSYSSPFVDYATNDLYVGDNTGHLAAFSGAYDGGTLAYVGGNFPVTVSANALTAPVVDVSGSPVDIFIGDSGGFLYQYTTAGVIVGTKLTLTTNSGAGGVRDGAVVDSTNSVGYVTAGCDSAGTLPQLTQFGYTGSGLTAKATADINYTGGSTSTNSCGSSIPMYRPALNNIYYTAGIGGTNAGVTVCETNDNGRWYSAVVTYEFSGGTMSTSYTGFRYTSVSAATTCSPLTEFYGLDVSKTPTAVTTATGNPTTVTVTVSNTFVAKQYVTIAGVNSGTGGCSGAVATAIDGEQVLATASGTAITFTIPVSTASNGTCTLSTPTAVGPTQDYLFYGTNIPEAFTYLLPSTSVGSGGSSATNTTTADVAGGTSGMIIDNDSGDGQASSIYFGTLAACSGSNYCAIKLTQSGLL
jgi:hypothetical protein